MSIKKIGVIGAGQMGHGLAHVAALAGYDVIMTDVDEAALTKALETIEGNMVRQIKRGIIKDEEMPAALKRIKTGQGFDVFKDCVHPRQPTWKG